MVGENRVGEGYGGVHGGEFVRRVRGRMESVGEILLDCQCREPCLWRPLTLEGVVW